MSKEEETFEEMEIREEKRRMLLGQFWGSKQCDSISQLAYDRATKELGVDFDEDGWETCGMCHDYSDVNEFVFGTDADPFPESDNAICNGDWPTLVELWAERINAYFEERIIPNAKEQLLQIAENGEDKPEGFLGRMLEHFTT